MAFIDK